MTTAKQYVENLTRIYMGKDSEYSSIDEYIELNGLEAQVMRDVNTNSNVGVNVTVAMGGPTVFIDTYNGVVVATEKNGGFSAEGLWSKVCEEINYFFGL